MTASPFLDPTAQSALYGTGDRLARRTSALHSAKVSGPPVPEAVASLVIAHGWQRAPYLVADIGCGRGSSTRVLAERLRPARLLGIDASSALLADARRRTKRAVTWVQADFHRLPLADQSCTAIVAAFCLYHSPRPETVIREIARCLVPEGVAVLVTKSADSYRELDDLVADVGLDPRARRQPSLYASANSGNLPTLASAALRVIRVEHEEHRFVFADARHLAAYLVTTPKYQLPLEATVREALPDRPLSTSSTVTYVVAVQPEGA